MSEKIINLGTISEDFEGSDCMFREIDDRSYLYSTNDYIPCSSINPIAWEDLELIQDDVPDLIEKGDKVITKEIAELIMSFDPFGVEIYPAKLIIENNEINGRYILSVKNIIDVIDLKRSDIFQNPKPNRPPIVSHLAISPEKLALTPLNKRLVFRAQESNAIFFDGDIINIFIKGLRDGHYYLCESTPFNTSELAPMR